MLLEEREHIILRNINSNGTATVRQLAQACDVTEVTVRRDLKRLEENKLLKRVFGGAVSIERSQYQTPQYTAPAPEAPDLPNTDALIMTTIDTRYAHTLRERAIRQDIPLIAEGNPQDGAVYLGIDNYETGHQLGQWSANYFRRHCTGSAHVLDIGVLSMSATRQRSKGFLDGLSAGLGDEVAALSIDGKGRYDSAYHMALDALRLHPEINLIFGINDDSILAGMQAYHDLGRDKSMLIAVSIGAEGNTIFDALMGKGRRQSLCLVPQTLEPKSIQSPRAWFVLSSRKDAPGLAAGIGSSANGASLAVWAFSAPPCTLRMRRCSYNVDKSRRIVSCETAKTSARYSTVADSRSSRISTIFDWRLSGFTSNKLHYDHLQHYATTLVWI